MKAKSKPIKKMTLEDLKVDIKSDIEIVEVTEPPKRKSGVIVSSVDELIDKLKNEAHVVWRNKTLYMYSSQSATRTLGHFFFSYIAISGMK